MIEDVGETKLRSVSSTSAASAVRSSLIPGGRLFLLKFSISQLLFTVSSDVLDNKQQTLTVVGESCKINTAGFPIPQEHIQFSDTFPAG